MEHQFDEEYYVLPVVIVLIEEGDEEQAWSEEVQEQFGDGLLTEREADLITAGEALWQQ